MTFFNKFNPPPVAKPKKKDPETLSLKELQAKQQKRASDEDSSSYVPINPSKAGLAWVTVAKPKGRPKGSTKKAIDKPVKRSYTKKVSSTSFSKEEDLTQNQSSSLPSVDEMKNLLNSPKDSHSILKSYLPKSPESTVDNDRDRTGRFVPGNKIARTGGRPEGTRTKAQVALESVSYESAEDLLKKMVELGMQGDVSAGKFVLERILPPAKGRRVNLNLPVVETISDIGDSMTIIVDAMSVGEITLEEAETATKVLEIKLKSFEQQELEKRVEGIEKTLNIKYQR